MIHVKARISRRSRVGVSEGRKADGREPKSLRQLNFARLPLEVERGSRIWCMTHKGRGYICYPTKAYLVGDRENIGKGKKLEILLHSNGGHPDIAYAAMKFFRRRFGTVNIFVPLVAKSAATLMCLGADKVIMGESHTVTRAIADPKHISTSYVERQDLTLRHVHATVHAARPCVLQKDGESRARRGPIITLVAPSRL